MNDKNDAHLLKRIEKSGDNLVTMVDEALTANFLAGITTIGRENQKPRLSPTRAVFDDLPTYPEHNRC